MVSASYFSNMSKFSRYTCSYDGTPIILRTDVTNTHVISPHRQTSRIRDMPEQCDGEMDTRTVLLLAELAVELQDYPIPTSNRTVGLSNFT